MKNFKLFLLKKKTLTVLACLLAAGGMLWAVNSPLVIGASATTRQLPIYCVQRDQKTIAISFDAAWGDVILRQGNSRVQQDLPKFVLSNAGMDCECPSPHCIISYSR